jgi:hypothetical protein
MWNFFERNSAARHTPLLEKFSRETAQALRGTCGKFQERNGGRSGRGKAGRCDAL